MHRPLFFDNHIIFVKYSSVNTNKMYNIFRKIMLNKVYCFRLLFLSESVTIEKYVNRENAAGK